MRTPREILLARHRAIEPKLDDIREDVVGNLNNKDAKTQSLSDSLASCLVNCLGVVWRELVMPSRGIWMGLAAVWILILAVNFSMRDDSGIRMAKSPPTPEVIMAFRQQQQLLSELLGPDEPPVAQPKKMYSPRPASERHLELLMA